LGRVAPGANMAGLNCRPLARSPTLPERGLVVVGAVADSLDELVVAVVDGPPGGLSVCVELALS